MSSPGNSINLSFFIPEDSTPSKLLREIMDTSLPNWKFYKDENGYWARSGKYRIGLVAVGNMLITSNVLTEGLLEEGSKEYVSQILRNFLSELRMNSSILASLVDSNP